ncbi:hypothetical protein [Cellulosilyticum ruminicola]|uniref:hypothetical protein n=1 Tax=Cellulosilyticum ruminicola TaxID=425254 RepID=UPI0006D0B286|nr:hypothetical protein [Cellulosilyticum ruminicola]
MREINCLNLTDIIQYLYNNKLEPIEDFDTLIKRSNALAGFEKCERIYIGSYFCAQYFLNVPHKIIEEIKLYCHTQKIKVTLVIPIFSERNLEKAKQKIQECIHELKEVLDEITINDYGMLNYVTSHCNLKYNLGRLFMKDYRDLRYPEYFNTILHPKTFNSYFYKIIEKYHINTIEFDPTHKAVNLAAFIPNKATASLKTCPQMEVAMHRPYCYVTVGQICEFGSIHKEIEKKFRPNEVCQGECNDNIFFYEFNDGHKWLRVGRAVYFDNRECEVQGVSQVRNIYFPVDLVVRK